MKYLLLLALLLMKLNSLHAQIGKNLRHPKTKKDNTLDTYFGQEIADPYRWLEDDNASETTEWVQSQNAYTQSHLQPMPNKIPLRSQMTSLWNYTKYSNPFKEGEYYLFYKNDGLQNQSVLYIQKGLEGTPKEFINPNTLNESGTSSLGSISISKKQLYCAYAVSNAGSDWQEIYVKEIATGKHLKDTIQYSKFSGISWVGDDGFYYSGYDKPKNESEKYSAKTEYQKVFFHKIGTSQSTDKLIYEDKNNPLRYKGAVLSEDENWLILSLSEGTDGSEIMFKNLKSNVNIDFKILCPGFKYNYDFVDVIQGKFLIHTNWNASNYQLIWIDPANPEEKNWKTAVAEKKEKLDGITRVGNKLFCRYLENACSKIDVCDLSGKFLYSISLPGLGTVAGFNGSSKDNITFYAYTSLNTPTKIFKYDVNSNKSELFKEAKLSNELAPTAVSQVWVPSKDGTMIPMFLYHRKDVDLKEGNLPVFMYGYGGFNIPLTPSFSIPMTLFVQHGGVYAMVNLRGGSEFGEQWHQAGMLSQKQNVFDDFISAAEYLISENITSKDKIAIHGRSNGGLLVGACMTQRPDLFKVALPGVGVLDMLRYQKFTVGWGWVVEYGSSDNRQDFDYLIKYSPLHNIKNNTDYPATMITTADHDDRVVPAHSFKFAAALQENNSGKNPILIRIDTQAGHGAGKPTSKQIDEWTDILTFTMFYLNMPLKF